jgi:hypothetical protein
MKESDTPLGKAYAKASDAAERRYLTYQYPRGLYTVNFIGDKVKGKVKIEVRTTDSNKLIKTFNNNDFSVNDMSDKKIPSEWKTEIDSRVPKDYDTPLGKGKPKKLAPSPLVEPKLFDPDKKYPPGQKPKSATTTEQMLKALGPLYDTPTGSKNKAQAKPFTRPKGKIKGKI